MVKEVKVDVNYSDKDITSALVEYMNKIYHMWVIFPVIGVIFISTLFAGFKDGFTTYIDGWLIVLLFLFLLLAYYYYYRPGARYIEAFRERRENLFLFTPDKIEITRKLSQSTCSWELFIKVYETKRNFLFLDKSKAVIIVPKRFFKGLEEMQGLREILNEIFKESFRKV